jgi:hypothetical protein
MTLVEVESFPDRTTAELARGLLLSQGIEAVLFDAAFASLGLGGLIPARLMVDERDRAAAERLLSTASA